MSTNNDYDNDTITSDAVIQRRNGKLEVIGYNPIVDGKRLTFMSPSKDAALLVGLGIKYHGNNSQFAEFACKMLGVKY